MIPAQFEYVRAGSAEEAISLIGEHGEDAKMIAGGHSLLPLMKLRLAQPSVLVTAPSGSTSIHGSTSPGSGVGGRRTKRPVGCAMKPSPGPAGKPRYQTTRPVLSMTTPYLPAAKTT